MCLSIYGKILKIKGNKAEVDFSGTVKDVNIELVDAKVGDSVLVYGGYAIEKSEKNESDKVQRQRK